LSPIHQPEDDLEELWLELARDLIDHARITREWLVRRQTVPRNLRGDASTGEKEAAIVIAGGRVSPCDAC
jgi:hypothetical protein